MKIFANLIYPIITVLLFLANLYYCIFIVERTPAAFLWLLFSSASLFFIMGLIRWNVDQMENKK